MATWSKLPLIPDSVLASLSSSLLIGAVGLLGFALSRPLLFASLGPTAFQLSEYPELKSSRVYNVLAGHFIALGMGFAAVAIMNAWDAPPVLSTHHVTLLRVWTWVLAMLFAAGAIMILEGPILTLAPQACSYRWEVFAPAATRLRR